MKIFVAGASGQVARALVARNDEKGLSIQACGRPACDLTHKAAIAGALDGVAPDVVVNAAAYTSVDRAEEDEEAAFAVNAIGAGNLAAAMAARGLPIIHLSTDYVFDGTKNTPYLESDRPSPLGAYGRSKLAGEAAVAAANAEHIILRTAWVYSPFGKSFVKTMLRLADGPKEVCVVADQFGCPTSAFDIADGVICVARGLANQKAPQAYGVFHIAGTGEATWADLAEAVFHESKTNGGPFAPVRRVPSSEFITAAPRPMNSRLDCGRLDAVYGVRLPSWRESLKPVVAALLRQGTWRD